MNVFIDFWKLETENSILHVFYFLYKLSFENKFFFSVNFRLLNKFFSLKNKKLFLEIENNEEKQLPNIPLVSPINFVLNEDLSQKKFDLLLFL